MGAGPGELRLRGVADDGPAERAVGQAAHAELLRERLAEDPFHERDRADVEALVEALPGDMPAHFQKIAAKALKACTEGRQGGEYAQEQEVATAQYPLPLDKLMTLLLRSRPVLPHSMVDNRVSVRLT